MKPATGTKLLVAGIAAATFVAGGALAARAAVVIGSAAATAATPIECFMNRRRESVESGMRQFCPCS